MVRINTSAVLNNSFNNGAGPVALTGPIALDPVMSSQYDFATTEDPVLLNERKRTAETLYEIFKASPYFEAYGRENEGATAKKVDKSDVAEVFYYHKDELLKRMKLSAFELVLAICEFFDFDYSYVAKDVLSVDMKSEIMEDYYRNGMKERIDEDASEQLF